MKYCTYRCRDYCVYNMFRCAVVLHRSNGHETRKHFVRYLSTTIYPSVLILLVHNSDRAFDYTTKPVQSTDSPSKHANTRTTAHSVGQIESNFITTRTAETPEHMHGLPYNGPFSQDHNTPPPQLYQVISPPGENETPTTTSCPQLFVFLGEQ